MQLTDNEPCPHLLEYITHHALNQAKYLKCERVARTPCPHPALRTYTVYVLQERLTNQFEEQLVVVGQVLNIHD